MKILSNGEVESLYDCLMTMYLIASNRLREKMLHDGNNKQIIVNEQNKITGYVLNAARTLKGEKGMMEAKIIMQIAKLKQPKK